MRIARRPNRVTGRRSRGRGQSLVEFALVLTPLFLILLGIIQFGFIFNAYITITNATREAAREATIYAYDRSLTAGQNDAVAELPGPDDLPGVREPPLPDAPYFTTTGTWTQSGDTFTNGDLTVTYALPAAVADSDPRTGQTATVQARYHQDLLIPFISALLPRTAAAG